MRLGPKVPIAIVMIAVLDFPIAVIPNDACPVDDAMESPKALIRLLDDSLHRAYIRHTRVHIQNLGTQFLDPLDCGDSRANGIIGRVASDPRVPGFSAWQAGTPDQHETGPVLRSEVLCNRDADLAKSTCNQIDAAL